MIATTMSAAPAPPWPRLSRETSRRLFGRPVARMAAFWLFLNGAGLLTSAPTFFHQPAFRFVAAAGLPSTFWGVTMLIFCIALTGAHLLGKPIFCALAMLFSGVFLSFFGSVLAITGYRFGILSVNGCWCVYIGIVCLVRLSPRVRPV